MSCPFYSESDRYQYGIVHSSTMVSLGFNGHEACLFCVGRLIERVGDMLKSNEMIPRLE